MNPLKVRRKKVVMKKNILAIDDNTGSLNLISIVLWRGGFDVVRAKDADSALAVIDQSIPDLIIMDVQLRGMNGLEFIRMLRGRADTGSIPIVVISGRADVESVMQGIEAGASDYLPKPLLHHDIAEKVRAMLEHAGHDMSNLHPPTKEEFKQIILTLANKDE